MRSSGLVTHELCNLRRIAKRLALIDVGEVAEADEMNG